MKQPEFGLTARMNRIRQDRSALRLGPLRNLVRDLNICRFARAISGHLIVRLPPLEINVVEPEGRGDMQPTRDVHDSSGRLGCSRGEDARVDEGGEEEGREVVRLELELVAVRGGFVCLGANCCVVNQDLHTHGLPLVEGGRGYVWRKVLHAHVDRFWIGEDFGRCFADGGK